MKLPFLLSLGRHSKQTDDEGDLPQFDRLGKSSRGFELGNGFGIGGILIDVDHARSRPAGCEVSRSRGLGHLLLDQRSLRS